MQLQPLLESFESVCTGRQFRKQSELDGAQQCRAAQAGAGRDGLGAAATARGSGPADSHMGIINRVLIDTAHVKGNYPDSCQLEACNVKDAEMDLTAPGINWVIVLPQVKLQADEEQLFEKDVVLDHPPVTHVRLNIFPDG